MPIPGVHRLYWHEARQVVPRELAAMAAGRASRWSWPATAVPSTFAVATNTSSPLVVVFSGSAVMAEAVSVALREVGWKTAVVQAARPNLVLGAEAIVWDVPAGANRADDEWETLQNGFAGLPVVALCGFPRPEDVVRLRSMGVDAVVGKPFQVADLVAAVERVVAERLAQTRPTIAAA
jgi:CheY-like chemotaxis protein